MLPGFVVVHHCAYLSRTKQPFPLLHLVLPPSVPFIWYGFVACLPAYLSYFVGNFSELSRHRAPPMEGSAFGSAIGGPTKTTVVEGLVIPVRLDTVQATNFVLTQQVRERATRGKRRPLKMASHATFKLRTPAQAHTYKPRYPCEDPLVMTEKGEMLFVELTRRQQRHIRHEKPSTIILRIPTRALQEYSEEKPIGRLGGSSGGLPAGKLRLLC